jgi:phosphate transport system permease protein
MTATSAPTPRVVEEETTRGDRLLDRLTFTSGAFVLVLLTLVGTFLLLQSRKALGETGLVSFLTRVEWRTDVHPARIGVLGMLGGTLLVSAVAIVIAIPLGVGTAVLITEYAPPRLRRALIGLVDLLAAVPALLFGIWGFLFLSDQLVPVARWLADNLGWIPIFQIDEGAPLNGSIFIAGVVVSFMVLPIITAVVREVFSYVPQGEKEAALAVGATRWGMIRTVVLPYGWGGIVGGSMLGLGRALGETIAVTLLLPQVPELSNRILQNGGATISGFITNRAGADAFTVSGLMGAGLVLFAITLAVNLAASVMVARSRSGAGVEI